MQHAAITGRHTLHFDIVGGSGEHATRVVDVYATREEIEQLATQGYLLRERLFPQEEVERLREAMDAVEADEVRSEHIARGVNFGGWFPRHLMDKHPTFLELIKFPPTVSVARAVLGPYVNIRQLGARVSYPGEPNQQTHWHIHRRHVPEPTPAFYVYPHTIDCLIYLDDTDDACGPLAILPGSHLGTHDDIAPGDLSEKPEQLTLRLAAGSCVIMHSNIWHRAYPTTPEGRKRRLLILCYGPIWMRRSAFGVKPEDGLRDRLLAETDDPEVRELLGVGGYQ
jgi:ectoine hydroxylase-related dioxygenase (phytanoyl-CoA dioxygenase family)